MNYGFTRSPNWIRRPVEARSAQSQKLLAIHLGSHERENVRNNRARGANLRVPLSTYRREDEFIDVSRVCANTPQCLLP